jgi:tRNA(Ile)-lysidine synthase
MTVGARFGDEVAMTVPRADLAKLVSRFLPRGGTAVVAVSGGLDSMSLLDVAVGVGRRRRCSLVVATYDHGSGSHSARAAAFVSKRSLAYGVPVVVGCAADTPQTEAAWRAARWDFLRSVARSAKADILTAHTRDDQLETVLMRAMRGAGARGLAGLRAESDVGRPFVEVSRRELRAYAAARGLEWMEDPTNLSRRYLRNRIRHDLLPALLQSRPALGAELIDIGERAALWRRELSALLDSALHFDITRDADGMPMLDIAAPDLTPLSPGVLAVVWPELAARAGVTLDRRGLKRAVEFATSARIGARVQLSGGWELSRARQRFELRAFRAALPAGVHPFAAPMTWERWAFSKISQRKTKDAWRATLSRELSLGIRAWRPGDKLTIRLGDRLISRKVKYFLSDAGISGHIRARWPVVVAGDEIVWIPGVRRSDAATARSGRPVVTYVCDYLDRRS